MIEINPTKIKEQRVSIDAHRYTLPDSYTADLLRDTSVFLDQLYQDLVNNGYCIIKKQKGGIDDKGGETGLNSESSS